LIWKIFAEKFHAALLAAVGHILRVRLTTLSMRHPMIRKFNPVGITSVSGSNQ
jgi:hypothetical protein